jgi:hypothetical protein
MKPGAERTPDLKSVMLLPAIECDYWNLRYSTKEFIWTVKPNPFLAAEIANLSPGRVLDLAAGEGRNAVWLA